jgi:hypothetical protein
MSAFAGIDTSPHTNYLVLIVKEQALGNARGRPTSVLEATGLSTARSEFFRSECRPEPVSRSSVGREL